MKPLGDQMKKLFCRLFLCSFGTHFRTVSTEKNGGRGIAGSRKCLYCGKSWEGIKWPERP